MKIKELLIQFVIIKSVRTLASQNIFLTMNDGSSQMDQPASRQTLLTGGKYGNKEHNENWGRWEDKQDVQWSTAELEIRVVLWP